MKRQAQYHGEIGANGRAYKKGQFIAEQPEYINGVTSKKSNKVRKMEVEPYVWIEQHGEWQSIYQFLNCYQCYLVDGKMIVNEDYLYNEFNNISEDDIKKVTRLVFTYNLGNRVFKKVKEGKTCYLKTEQYLDF